MLQSAKLILPKSRVAEVADNAVEAVVKEGSAVQAISKATEEGDTTTNAEKAQDSSAAADKKVTEAGASLKS